MCHNGRYVNKKTSTKISYILIPEESTFELETGPNWCLQFVCTANLPALHDQTINDAQSNCGLSQSIVATNGQTHQSHKTTYHTTHILDTCDCCQRTAGNRTDPVRQRRTFKWQRHRQDVWFEWVLCRCRRRACDCQHNICIAYICLLTKSSQTVSELCCTVCCIHNIYVHNGNLLRVYVNKQHRNITFRVAGPIDWLANCSSRSRPFFGSFCPRGRSDRFVSATLITSN